VTDIVVPAGIDHSLYGVVAWGLILGKRPDIIKSLFDQGANMYAQGHKKTENGTFESTTAWELIRELKSKDAMSVLLNNGYTLSNEGSSHFTGSKLFFPWADEIDAHIKNDPSTTVNVTVTFLQGSGMAPKDFGIKAKDKEGKGSSDPYIKIFLVNPNKTGKEQFDLKWKSEMFPKVLDATFVTTDIAIDLGRLPVARQLMFVVWDYDTFTPDDFMGAASVHLAPLSLFNVTTFSTTLPLSAEDPMTGKTEADITGTLQVSLKLKY